MKTGISILILAFLIPIFSTNILYAEEIRLMSYYPVPVGNYEIIRVGRLDASGDGNFLTIRNNDANTEHWLFSSSNDDMVLSHSESTYDLLIENTGYIGIGTNDPSCNLHIKDVTETADDFVGIRLESRKGNEEGIYFHFTEGGLGRDVGWIRNRYNYDPTDPRHEMIIGNDPGYNTQLNISSNLINIGTAGCDIYFPEGTGPAALDSFGLYYDGTQWHLPIHEHLPSIPSSRELKKDITPLLEEEYQDMLSKLDDLEIVRFRYKTDPEESKLRIGVIAEDSPDEITTEDKKALDNVSTIGFILAILKAQNEEIKMLKEEIEKLEKKELSKLR